MDALVLRDDHLTGGDGSTSFTLQERVYVTQDANYNVTSLIQWGTLQADANSDGFVNQFDFSIMVGHYNVSVPRTPLRLTTRWSAALGLGKQR